MPNTARLAIPYPSAADTAGLGNAQIQAAVAQIDVVSAGYTQGPYPPPVASGAYRGFTYWATDRKREFYCDGVAWYPVGQSGVYGDASDGVATLDGATAVVGMTRVGSTYTMTRDVVFMSLTINAGSVLITNGFRLFCAALLTNNGTIQYNGVNSGGQGASAALAAGSLGGAPAGGAGSAAGVGTAGSNAANSLGGAGGAGATNGNSGEAGGAGGTATAPAAGYGTLHTLPQASLGMFLGVAGAPISVTGGGGGGGAGGGTLYGGGGGSGGGVVVVVAATIAGVGNIQARGGPGSNGGAGGGSSAGGGGGGGGVVIVISSSVIGGAVAGQTIDANGGPAGVGAGTLNYSGTAGTNGSVILLAS